MKQYGIRQFYNNVKEDGLMSALKYDVKETIARHPKAATGATTGLVLVALANGGYITDNRHIPEDSGTKSMEVMKTLDQQVKDAYGEHGLWGAVVGTIGGIASFLLVRGPVNTVYTPLKTIPQPVDTVKETITSSAGNLGETALYILTGVGIANAGSGSATSTTSGGGSGPGR